MTLVDRWKRFFLCALLIGGGLALRASPSESEGVLVGSIEGLSTYPYRLFVPSSASADEPLPLLVFLAGLGERGTDNAIQVTRHLPALVNATQAPDSPYRAILLAPQSPSGWWDGARVNQLVDEIEARYPVDRSRIYLSGFSAGGGGCYVTVADFPERWASVAPLSAVEAPATADKLIGTPLWLIHGELDTGVSPEQSRRMFDLIREAGGHPRLTLIEGWGHGPWTPIFEDDLAFTGSYQGGEANDTILGYLPWLFSHRLEHLPETRALSSARRLAFDFLIPASGGEDEIFDGDEWGVRPGDRIGLEAGVHGRIHFLNLRGTESNPVTIVNEGGKVEVRSSRHYGVKLSGCSHLRLSGAGSSAMKHGIELTGGSTMGVTVEAFSTEVELDHLEIHGQGFAGIVAKTDPRCDLSANRGNFVMRNLSIHDNLIYETGGEGMYIGHSFYAGYDKNPDCPGTVLYPHVIEGLEIYRNIVHHTDAEGIQVGCAVRDVRIHHNHVSFAGQDPFGPYQDRGVQLGAGTSGEFYANFISDVSSTGLIVQSYADNRIYNNVIVRTGGVLMDEGPGEVSRTGFEFCHNTIVDSFGPAISLRAEKVERNRVFNNLVVHSDPSPAFDWSEETVPLNEGGNLVFRDWREAGFVDASLDDFRLRPDSPAVDAGANLEGLLEAVDFEGRKRDAIWDCGAFEAWVTP